MRREARCGIVLAVGLVIVVGWPGSASGQEWFELYDDGVAALRDGDGAEAVGLLRRASEARPEPGRLVPTYGTNFEPLYLPYLRLAEAHLLLDAVDDAVDALAVSSRYGVASDAERAPIEARVEAALAARQPAPAPVPPPSPPPAAVETRAAPPPASVEPDETSLDSCVRARSAVLRTTVGSTHRVHPAARASGPTPVDSGGRAGAPGRPRASPATGGTTGRPGGARHRLGPAGRTGLRG